MPCLLYAGTADPLARELPRAAAVLFGGFDHMGTFSNRAILPYVKAFLQLAGDPPPASS